MNCKYTFPEKKKRETASDVHKTVKIVLLTSMSGMHQMLLVIFILGKNNLFTMIITHSVLYLKKLYPIVLVIFRF